MMAPLTPAPRFITEWRTVDADDGHTVHHKNWQHMEAYLERKGREFFRIEKRYVTRSTWRTHRPDLPEAEATRRHRVVKEDRRCHAVRGVLEEHWGTDVPLDTLTRRIFSALREAGQ